MIRIAGRNINGKKQLRFAITPIRGVGKSNSKKIIQTVFNQVANNSNIELKMNFDEFYNTNFNTLPEEVIVLFRNVIENDYLTEDDLRRQNQTNIKRLIDLKAWRGLRHKAGMPVRGQTTRTNSRTRRGNQRNTKGSGKIKTAAKT